MYTTTKKLIGLITVVVAAAASLDAAKAQTVNEVLWTNAGSASWNTPANWSVFGVPSLTFNEVAIINNDGTAFLDAAASFSIGGVTIGRGDGLGGTLEIRENGALTVVNNGVTDGFVNVGVGGQDGRLVIERGGSLTAPRLSTFPTTSSEVVLGGGSGSGVATLDPDVAFLRTRTQLIGPNVAFSTNSLSFDNSSVLSYEVTGAGNSTIDVSGPTLLAGTVELTFNGVTPSIGESWTLIDSQALVSDVLSVTSPAALPAGAVLTSQKTSGGTNGALFTVGLEETVTLRVDRSSGLGELLNESGLPISLSGYQISSPAGALNAGWNSLADQGVLGFEEASPTANQISELSSGGVADITAGGTSIGLVYTPPTPAFGTPLDENLTFSVQRSDGLTTPGIVEFVGEGLTNNLVLTIDPATGNARITNDSSTAVGIDVYSIASDSSALLTSWDSLADQGIGGWQEANPSTSRVSELEPEGQLNLAPSGFVDLEGLWNDGVGVQDAEDIEFIFRAVGLGEFEGVVEFAAISDGELGDYDDDGIVSASDYAVWRDSVGSGATLPNDATPGVVDQSDYAEWASRFGSGGVPAVAANSAAAAVPEPSAYGLVLATLGAAFCIRCRKRLTPTPAFAKGYSCPRSPMKFMKVAAVVGVLISLTVNAEAQTTITGSDIAAGDLSMPFTDGSITISPFAAGGAAGSFGSGAGSGFIGVDGGNNPNALDDVDGDPATTGDRERIDITLTSGVGLSQIGYSFSRAYPIRISGFTSDPLAFFSATDDATDLLFYDAIAGELSIYQRSFSGNVTTIDFLNTQASASQTLSVTVEDLIDAGPAVAFSSFSYDLAAAGPVPGDVDGDGFVTLTDFGVIRDNLGIGTVRSAGDLTLDGQVDIADFAVWEANFPGDGGAVIAALNVPEPSSVLLLMLGFVTSKLRRRR